MPVALENRLGLQFVIHLAKHYTVPQLAELAKYAQDLGFGQVWVNDSLGYRNVFVILSAMAAQVDMKLGTAIMVPYYRHPMDAASAIASISELTSPHEFSVGIARGGGFRSRRPITMLRETVQFLRQALSGEDVQVGEYPFLASYFSIDPDVRVRLEFAPKSPILFYCGANGPKSLDIAGRYMDGVLFGGWFLPVLRTGKLQGLLDIADNAARETAPHKRLRNVAEINVSLSSDTRAARDFPRPYVVDIFSNLEERGFTDEDFAVLGVDPSEYRRAKDAVARGATREEAAPLVTDAMVDAVFIAGDPKTCRERIIEVCEEVAGYGFDQIVLAKLGPDYAQVIRLLSEEVLPAFKQS